MVLGLGALPVHFLLSNDIALYQSVGLAGVGLMLLGIAWHRPPRPLPWVVTAVGQGLMCAGDVVYDSVTAAYPGPADALYLTGSALIVAGMLALAAGSVRFDLGGHLDVFLVMIGIGIAGWCLLFDNRLGSGAGAAGLVSVAYPLADLALLGVLVRLFLEPGRRSPSYWLLLAGALPLLVADGGYVIPALAGTYGSGTGWPDAGWLASYVFFGAAALHPSMTRVLSPAPAGDLLPLRRILVVGLGVVAAPVAVMVQDQRSHDVDVLGVAIASTVLVLLVVARFLFVVRELERLKQRAEDSERKFRLVFERAPVGISIGRDGLMTETNPALQRMLGYTGDELVRMHYTQITHPDDAMLDLDAELQSGRRDGFALDKRCLAKDGRVVPVHVNIALDLSDGLGVSVIEDVTQRNELEAQLLQSQKMDAVGKLAGGIAHDFNNLMTAVLGYSDFLLRETSGVDRRKVETIRDAALRASELTRQLLAFSRQQMLRVEEVDLREAVTRMASLLQPLLGAAVRLETHLGDVPVLVSADPTQLDQVVMNLAVNARDAMPGGGRLSIAVATSSGEATLTVADEGVGMDEATVGRAFEPFFTTKPVGEGSGLGLSTVHGIVGQSGGTVDLESSPGAGTVVTVRLPLARRNLQPGEAAATLA